MFGTGSVRLRNHPQQTNPSNSDICLRATPAARIGLAVSPRELLVLIIRDHGLRSSLIGRLSLRGENLLTIERDPQDPELARLARPPAILIIDTEILGDRLPALRQGSHWEAIVVLAPRA